ncbi:MULTISPECIES: serine hydrolase [Cytobacillus]|uniref:serine hydrolase n=1 Tax=Cytobacillus TaxID=2675230 RepID=UPI00203A3B8F|nr:serine hydrolase [Cytobacillus firmus]MCM3706351.1 class A beta-lactamase-related serine hydrolase [Cytobacillus firmus]URM35057.1 class A beta-lactamase-related serine hydrolase [Cytobacillus firmus]
MFRIIVIIVLILAAALAIFVYLKGKSSGDPESIIGYVQEHKNTENMALVIRHNDEDWVNINEDVPLPLASTVKIIVAIEYARQAESGKIDPKEKVDLKTLETYYVPKTDGGAHQAWIDSLSEEAESVPLSEVANGMIAYSSNANTDFLLNVLGIENVNELADELKLPSHEKMYPIVSALYIPMELMEEEGFTKEEALNELKGMTLEEYRTRAIEIHQKWESQPPNEREKAKAVKVLDMDFQRIWSDRLPRASAGDYADLMRQLNSKNSLSKEVHSYLDPVLEQLMKNPSNREWLRHAGQKGGSTAFVFTISMYATDKEGNRTEMAFFANDLNNAEFKVLSRNMNSFQLEFLTNSKFRNSVREKLN